MIHPGAQPYPQYLPQDPRAQAAAPAEPIPAGSRAQRRAAARALKKLTRHRDRS